MATFSADELALLDTSKEVSIETRSGKRVYTTIIWVVVAEGSPYVRSFLIDGRWYHRALADPRVALIADDTRIEATAIHVTDDATNVAVSDGFRAKYRGKSMEAMVRPEVFDLTFRLEPVAPRTRGSR